MRRKKGNNMDLANEKIKKLNWLDVAFIKLSCIFFGLFVASFMINFVEKNKWLWLGLFVLFGIKPLYTIWIKKEEIRAGRLKQGKNKKGALELSIGTIVIIVLAVTMLILGIVFVKSIMCSGIQIGEDVTQGVKNEIKTLFGADKYGVRCMGEGSQEIKLASGGRRKIVCMIKTEEQTEYDLKIKEVEGKKGAPTKTVEKWIIDEDWNGFVKPGEDKEAVVLLLDLPKDAPTTSLKITIDAKNLNTDTTSTHISYIDVVPVGFLKTTIC